MAHFGVAIGDVSHREVVVVLNFVVWTFTIAEDTQWIHAVEP